MKEIKVSRVDISIPGPENIKSKGQRLAYAWHDEGQNGGQGGQSRRNKGRRMGGVAAGNQCLIRHPSGLAGGRTLAFFTLWGEKGALEGMEQDCTGCFVGNGLASGQKPG